MNFSTILRNQKRNPKGNSGCDDGDSWCDFKDENKISYQSNLLNAPKLKKRLEVNYDNNVLKKSFMLEDSDDYSETSSNCILDRIFDEEYNSSDDEGIISSCLESSISIDSKYSTNNLLIQKHSESGYTYVKNINFGPWRNR